MEMPVADKGSHRPDHPGRTDFKKVLPATDPTEKKGQIPPSGQPAKLVAPEMPAPPPPPPAESE
jgi:hypothetical protein